MGRFERQFAAQTFQVVQAVKTLPDFLPYQIGSFEISYGILACFDVMET